MRRIKCHRTVASLCAFALTVCASQASKIVEWGSSSMGGINPGVTNPPADITTAVAVAAGYFHSLALTADGRVVAWGHNYQGQTNVPADLTNVVAIAAGPLYSLALTHDGRVRGWGYNYEGQTDAPLGLSNVVQIAAGSDFNLALRANGSVVVWGASYMPACPLTNCIGIAAGGGYSVALANDGRVVIWNSVMVSWLPQMEGALAVGIGDAVMALTADERLSVWPKEDFRADIARTLTNVVQISVQREWCLVLHGNGKLTGWGAVYPDIYWGHTNPPSGLNNVISIAAGRYHGLAVVDSGSSYYPWSLPCPVITTNGPVLEIPTLRGRLYVVESSDEVRSTRWTVRELFAGDGSLRRTTMTNSAQAFYRVRRVP